MNAYIYHMLLRARELDNLNHGMQGRDTPRSRKCPFCVADEDATWFKSKIAGYSQIRRGYKHAGSWQEVKCIGPYCFNCPLLSVTGWGRHKHKWLMNDCVGFGKDLLRSYEERGDDV